MKKVDTKSKILIESLLQLNRNGLEGVSIRTIANALGISSGNLTYHYKNIDVIIYELYLNLVEELNELIQKVAESHEINLQWVNNNTILMYEVLWKYKFILLDFIAIARRIPKMKVHFKDLMDLRKLQFQMVFDLMIKEGLMIKEPFPGLYDRIMHQMRIFTNAWIIDAELLYDGEKEKVIPYYMSIFQAHIVPYFTPKLLKQMAIDD